MKLGSNISSKVSSYDLNSTFHRESGKSRVYVEHWAWIFPDLEEQVGEVTFNQITLAVYSQFP